MGGPVMNRLIDWAAMHDHEVHGQPGKHEKLSAGNQSEQKKRTGLGPGFYRKTSDCASLTTFRKRLGSEAYNARRWRLS